MNKSKNKPKIYAILVVLMTILGLVVGRVYSFTSQNMYLQNGFPVAYDYVITADGLGNYQFIKYDGSVYENTNLTKVEDFAHGNLTSGGVIYCKEVTWASAITLSNTVTVLEAYQGKYKVYNNLGNFLIPQLASDPATAGWGATETGRLWYNTADKVFKFWNNTNVVTLSTGGGTGGTDDDTMYLFINGTRALTANWNTGAFQIYGASWMNTTSLNANAYYWNTLNRTDAVANPVGSASYIIDVVGSTYRMINQTTGQVDVQSTNASYVLNTVFALVTGPPVRKVVLMGNFTIDHAVVVHSYTYVDATQAIIIVAPAVAQDAVQFVSGCTMSEWHGGTIISNGS